MKAKIQFAVEGNITQTLNILNGESPEIIAKKLATGEYVTSVSGYNYIVRTDQIGNEDCEKIAIIEDQDLETEYSDWIIID